MFSTPLDRDFVAGKMPDPEPPRESDPARGLAMGIALGLVIWGLILAPFILL